MPLFLGRLKVNGTPKLIGHLKVDGRPKVDGTPKLQFIHILLQIDTWPGAPGNNLKYFFLTGSYEKLVSTFI